MSKVSKQKKLRWKEGGKPRKEGKEIKEERRKEGRKEGRKERKKIRETQAKEGWKAGSDEARIKIIDPAK